MDMQNAGGHIHNIWVGRWLQSVFYWIYILDSHRIYQGIKKTLLQVPNGCLGCLTKNHHKL